MKKFFILFSAAVMMFAAGCKKVDLSGVEGRLDSLEQRMDAVEALLDASKKGLTIASVVTSDEGWLFIMSDGSQIAVNHGKDGADGNDGLDGADGKDGQDGQDGANGKDGADGKDGLDGDTLIESIVVGDTEVTFTLTDGRVFSIALYNALSIAFDDAVLTANSEMLSWTLHYTITSNLTNNITIEVVSSSDIRINAVAESATDGYVHVQTSGQLDEFSHVSVIVSNGEKTIIKAVPLDGVDFTEATSELNMKMIFVEGGEFYMGATEEHFDYAHNNEYPVRLVTLDSYYIGECVITQAQWEKVMGTTIKDQLGKELDNYYGLGDDYPIHFINWDDAVQFCTKLSELTGRTYCLPTEAQWEYAARGGKNHDNTIYSGSNDIDAVAWYRDNSDNSAHPVKQKQPNSLGLYDMSGTVFEWCSDWFADTYDENDTINPKGPATGENRVLRGGGFNSITSDCRVSSRGYNVSVDSRAYTFGIRVVCIM